jgi:hypothetical protein
VTGVDEPEVGRAEVGGPAPGAEARLDLLERRVAAQAQALARVPLNLRVPEDVIALLATAPGELDLLHLPPRCRPRLVALIDQLQALIENVSLRRRELGGRLMTVNAARRAGPAAHLVDYRS